MPLARAFLLCGWRCLPVDWVFDPAQDLADSQFQAVLHEQLHEVVFIAALDCSTKTILDELQALQDRRGSSLRANPDRGLHLEACAREAHVADRRFVGHQLRPCRQAMFMSGKAMSPAMGVTVWARTLLLRVRLASSIRRTHHSAP